MTVPKEIVVVSVPATRSEITARTISSPVSTADHPGREDSKPGWCTGCSRDGSSAASSSMRASTAAARSPRPSITPKSAASRSCHHAGSPTSSASAAASTRTGRSRAASSKVTSPRSIPSRVEATSGSMTAVVSRRTALRRNSEAIASRIPAVVVALHVDERPAHGVACRPERMARGAGVGEEHLTVQRV